MLNIATPDKAILPSLWEKINSKTKPPGSLGELENIAAKIGWIQQSLTPGLAKPVIMIFAADHGIAAEGIVNPYPQEVTWQMVQNFLKGGAAINVFARQNNMEIKVVDAGVNYQFEQYSELIQAKIAMGTRDYQHEPAMTMEQCEEALEKGMSLVRWVHSRGTNIIGFGEMGIGNTSSASLLMSAFTGLPISECVGSGTGLDPEGITKKQEVLQKVQWKHRTDGSHVELLATYGGFEIAMMCGGMLQAAELGMVIIIDGFITTAALLTASKFSPRVSDFCLFSHVSSEKGHQKLLDHFNARPILNLNMRLGEGTGAAISYPVIKAAVGFLNVMATFDGAEVSAIVDK